MLGKKSINIKKINISDTVKEKLLSTKSEIPTVEMNTTIEKIDINKSATQDAPMGPLNTSGTTPLQLQSVSLK